MNLFEQNQNEADDSDKPLAYRMRPQNLSDLYGQEDIIGKDRPLRRAIEADLLQSIILYGPPGSGKTSLAQVIANKTEANFTRLNAVTSGVKDIRKVIKKANSNQKMYNKKNILFIDEIHRFNKSQQDALLPAVEEGLLIMIGATTENPYFEVNSPLLSRSQVFRLYPLDNKDITYILKKALDDKMRGLGEYKVSLSEDILEYIAELADGDARTALNILEMAVLTTPPDNSGRVVLSEKIIAQSVQQKRINYDKSGDNHYDNISAMIKSMRGSDPDAAVFYLAKMLEVGEDPRFIARRLVVHAAEDVGVADPESLLVANAAAKAVEYVGMPEARIPLAEAVIHISTAPKSNSVIKAIDSALNYIRNNSLDSVPAHLKDSHYKGAKDLDIGENYLYPHDYSNSYIEQQYLPDNVVGEKFYNPGKLGYEKKIRKWFNYIKKSEEN